MLHPQIRDKNSKPRPFFHNNDTYRQKVANLSGGVEGKGNTSITEVDKMQRRPKNGKSEGKNDRHVLYPLLINT